MGGLGGLGPPPKCDGRPRSTLSVDRVARRPWRWRESNPRPPSPHQGFSVRSPLCLYSAPPVSRTSRCDGPSRCECPARSRDRTWRWSLLNDAGHRVGGFPGPTTSLPNLRRRGRSQRDSCWRLLVVQRRLRWSPACTGTLPLTQRPESKPFTPLSWIGHQHNVCPRPDHSLSGVTPGRATSARAAGGHNADAPANLPGREPSQPAPEVGFVTSVASGPARGGDNPTPRSAACTMVRAAPRRGC